MPRLIVTAGAVRGIARCRTFLQVRDEGAAERAGATIQQKLSLLHTHPRIGRPIKDGLRELVIPFGRAGYVALYRYEQVEDAVYLLAFRHQREAGY